MLLNDGSTRHRGFPAELRESADKLSLVVELAGASLADSKRGLAGGVLAVWVARITAEFRSTSSTGATSRLCKRVSSKSGGTK